MTRADLPTPDVLEEIFHRSLKDGDARGVDASLKLMAVQDPRRAQDLLEAVQLGLALRQRPYEITLDEFERRGD